MSRRVCVHMFLYLHVYISVRVVRAHECVREWYEKPVMSSLCVIPCNTDLASHYHFSLGLFWCSEPHQRGLWLGGRGVGGGLARCAPSFPLRGVPGTACTSGKPSLTTRLPRTANAVFEQGRGLPRHAEHTRRHAGKGLHAHTNRRAHTLRLTPVEFNTCLEDAAESVEPNLESVLQCRETHTLLRH